MGDFADFIRLKTDVNRDIIIARIQFEIYVINTIVNKLNFHIHAHTDVKTDILTYLCLDLCTGVYCVWQSSMHLTAFIGLQRFSEPYSKH